MAHVRPSSSAVDIANQALSLLGANAITSFGDGDENADMMARIYEQTKHEMFRGYPWNFAQRRSRLAQLAAAPITTDWPFQYALPQDCIRLLKIWNEGKSGGYFRGSGYDNDFSVEGRNVLCNVNPAYAVYVADVDESDFMFQFTDALIFRLAMKAAYGITGSNTRVGALKEDYQESLEEARTTDALEGTTYPLQSNRFTQVRF